MSKPLNRMESLESRTMLAGSPMQIGGRSYDVAMKVGMDSAGNRIVAGIFSGTVDFDNGSGVTSLTAIGNTDLYVAKYTESGSLVWAKRFGGGAGELEEEQFWDQVQATTAEFEQRTSPLYQGLGEVVNDLAVGLDDSVYFTGSFSGTADFVPDDDTRGNRRSAGFTDIYVCKLDANGATAWFSTMGGIFNDVAKGIALDGADSVLVTGYFTRTADFNPSSRTFNVNAVGRDDVFVTKLFQSSGSHDWTVTTGGDAVDLQLRDVGEDIAVDEDGAIYVTGSFAGNKVDFAPGAGQSILKSDETDGFMWVLSPRGKMHLARGFGGGSFDSGARIAVGDGDRIFVSGYFSEEADLDPTSAVQMFEAVEDDDFHDRDVEMFAYEYYMQSDTTLWISHIQTEGLVWIGDMAVHDGEMFLTGGFSGRLLLDDAPRLTSIEGDDDFEDSRSRDHSYDIFTIELAGGSSLTAFESFGAAGDDYGIGIVHNGDGITVVGRFKGTVDFAPGAAVSKLKSRQDDGFLIELAEEIV